MKPRLHLPSLLAIVLAVVAAVPLLPVASAARPAAPSAGEQARVVAADDSATSVTKSQDWRGGGTGSVTVSKTRDLRDREVVRVSWEGFRPTENAEGAQSAHSEPQTPLSSAYPVVLMQCQGTDPATITPEDCPVTSRSLYYAPFDALETEAIQQQTTGDFRAFVDTAGQRLESPGLYEPTPMPEDIGGNVIGTNWYGTWTDPDGTRTDARFEMRTTKQHPQSLGCNDPDTRAEGACSLVVVPIRPMQCLPDALCPEPTETSGLTGDYRMWQSASNWSQRFVFPLTFAPFPEVCDLDSRDPVGAIGSELLDDAMLSWVPRFCGDSDLFKLAYTRASDGTARRQLTAGLAGSYLADAAFVTLPVAADDLTRPLAYAPVALTGFVVAFGWDDEDFEAVDQLNLNAGLLAKLVTQSYRKLAVPQLEGNPPDLLSDPEFRALNPDLVNGIGPGHTLDYPVLVQGDHDLVHEVTRYIAADPKASAWLSGKPDQWGMKVNKDFRNWSVPAVAFETRDDYVAPATGTEENCPEKPALERFSQFAFNLQSVAQALLDRQPQNVGLCEPVTGTDEWQWKKPLPQPLGQRRMIAITDLPHAERYQLPSASLQNASGAFVAPDRRSLAAALAVADRDRPTGTLTASLGSRARGAYPGFMAVNAAIPTQGLSDADANTYADLVTYLAGPGQRYGESAGQLPAGYLALTPALRRQALAAAADIRAQNGELPPDGGGPDGGGPDGGGPDSGAPGTDGFGDGGFDTPGTGGTSPPGTGVSHGGVPGGGVPDPAAPGNGGSPDPDGEPEQGRGPGGKDAVEPLATKAQTSATARWLLPALLLGGLGGLVLASTVLAGPAAVRRAAPTVRSWRGRAGLGRLPARLLRR